MKKIKIILLVVATLALAAPFAFSARLFAGYGGLKWGTDIHTVSKIYRKGTLGKIGDQMVYTQANPDRTTRQRTFGFRNNGLSAVSITFDSAHVAKVGIDKLLAQLIRNFGEGRIDRTSAPHLISYIWEDPSTRITLAYSGRSHDMTVLIFQQKSQDR